MNTNIKEQIESHLRENDVVLFMKGTSDFPLCGFSSRVVSILNHLNVKFKAINVLENDELRQGIKDYSNWPTIPQIYVRNGQDSEFLGGCDILTEMFETGELQSLLRDRKLIS